MLFIDLKKLKIVKDFHYNTVEREIKFNLDESVVAQSDALIGIFQEMIKPSPLAVSYIVDIQGEGLASDDEAYYFITAVNAICSIFFANMIKEDGRKREHRFDVPENLQIIKTSRSIMKKAINQQTINDVFNLTIKYKDLIYILCDEKTAQEDESDA